MVFGKQSPPTVQSTSDRMVGALKAEITLEAQINGKRSIPSPQTRYSGIKGKNSQAKAICRRLDNRLIDSPQIGYLKNMSDIDDPAACHLSRPTETTEGGMDKLGKSTRSANKSTEAVDKRDSDEIWHISLLKEYRLIPKAYQTGNAEHPGVIGDGSCNHRCKLCGGLEDRTGTLICDICEESFHMSCCKLKVKSIPIKDDWRCPSCRRKRKRQVGESLIGTSAGVGKASLLGEMLEEKKLHRTLVRIGNLYQAEVPDWTGRVAYAAESSLIGVVLSSEENLVEKELAEYNMKNNLWPKDWKLAKSLSQGMEENWLQCQSVLYKKGEVCPDGQKAKKDLICGKWRRAPLCEVQNEDWECSCAVVWDPYHADCVVPQELHTEDILRHVRARKVV